MNTSKLSSPLSVCWNITNKCNDNCQFCFRNCEAPELDIYKNNYILDKFIEGGVKKVSFIGGEPLVYDSLDFLLNKAKRAGIITSITTNGLCITEEWLESHENIVDWLTLALDGSNIEVQTAMTRNEKHFENVIHILNYIQDKKLKYNLKINSVASKVNIDDMRNIYSVIKDRGIKRWKIFKFYSVRGVSIENEKKFSITKEAYMNLKKEIISLHKEDNQIKIEFIDDEKLDSHHFIVFPDGCVSATQKGKDCIKGNILEDDLSAMWEYYFNNIDEHLESHKWLII